MLNELLLTLVVRKTKEVYLKNELKTVIREAKTTYLRAAMSRARANLKLAAYLWKCVNGLIGRDKFHTTGLPQGVL